MTKKGRLTLVGGGPGDPGLLTLAGKAALEKADVILHDRLVGREVLAMLPPRALAIDVGKSLGRHSQSQEQINRIIVEHALAGKRVVRLKGGDPCIFGRGAEELDAARRHGIPCVVIPGVTSAIAAPAYAGIPLTYREHSSSLHILTGRAREGRPPDIPFEALARTGGTLVFLMSLSVLADIRDGLLAAGMPADTPAALLENGARGNQRRLVATLAGVPELARKEAFSSPTLLVVGAVCALAGTFDWTAGLPLWGKEVLAVSSRETASRMAAGLREQGCGVDEFSGIRMEPLPPPESLGQIVADARWIVLTSSFGVECFFGALRRLRLDIRAAVDAKFAAVGKRTAVALEDHGIFAAYVPEEYNGRALAIGLCERVAPGERILLYRAGDGARDLPETLAGHGLAFDAVAAYRTLANTPEPALLEKIRAGGYDAVTFTSASAVAAFAAALPEGNLPAAPALCIGEATAAEARRHGMRAEVSREATVEALVDLTIEKAGRP